MEVSRVDGTQAYGSTQAQNQDYARQRLTLHQGNTFQKGGSGLDLSALKADDAASAVNNTQEGRTLQTRDGNEIDIPQLDGQQRAQVAQLQARVSKEGWERLQIAGLALGKAAFAHVAASRAAAKGEPGSQAQLEAATSTLRAAAMDNVTAVTAETFQKHTSALTVADLNKAMTDSMTNGMAGVEGDLNNTMHGYAQKAQQGQVIDTDVAELGDMLANWPAGSSQQFTWHESEKDANGKVTIVEKTGTLTEGQAKDLLDKLKAEANDLESLTAVEQISLQVQVQDYQQAMTTLSNIMKSMDDNLKGIIQNAKT